MVQEVRSGRSLRTVAAEFGVSVSTVAYWVDYSRGKRIDRVVFGNLTPGRAWNRTTPEMEQRILSARRSLREESVLGEYGAEAIALALQSEPSIKQVPSRATIHRVLARHGALDGVHRQRRRAPPRAGICPISPAGRPSSTALTSSRT
jgi:transposase